VHILLIEPDALLARSYTSLLEHDSHTVTHTTSAQRAVQLVDERLPDLVLLELQLSGHNGVEFLYELRSYQEWLSVPIIVLTFVPLGELIQIKTLSSELGVARILYKPTTSLDKLRQVIRQVSPQALCS
jgi:chemosensory pili system protein ChpA (sensor histidine kinase/response regulator)